MKARIEHTSTQTEVHTTIGAIAEHWSSDPAEWGLLGDTSWSPDEHVRFTEVDGGWRLERHADDKNIWYDALGKRFEVLDLPITDDQRETLTQARTKREKTMGFKYSGRLFDTKHGAQMAAIKDWFEPAGISPTDIDDFDYEVDYLLEQVQSGGWTIPGLRPEEATRADIRDLIEAWVDKDE